MKKNNLHKDLQKDFESIYDSLGKREPLEANPFLFTRIEQKIEELEQKKSSGYLSLAQRLMQPVFMSFLLAIALFVGIKIGSMNRLEKIQPTQEHTTEYFLNDMNQELIETTLLKE